MYSIARPTDSPKVVPDSRSGILDIADLLQTALSLAEAADRPLRITRAAEANERAGLAALAGLGRGL